MSVLVNCYFNIHYKDVVAAGAEEQEKEREGEREWINEWDKEGNGKNNNIWTEGRE